MNNNERSGLAIQQHTDIESKRPVVLLQTRFTKTLHIYYSNLQHKSSKKCFKVYAKCLNIIILFSDFPFDALSWRAQLCTQHLKGLHNYAMIIPTQTSFCQTLDFILAQHVDKHC